MDNSVKGTQRLKLTHDSLKLLFIAIISKCLCDKMPKVYVCPLRMVARVIITETKNKLGACIYNIYS